MKSLCLAIAGAFFCPAAAYTATDLVLAIGGEPETGFDPMLGWGSYGNPLFQSTLLKRDAALETQPDLAMKWALSDDRLTWTITLRDDVTFSDGTPLTARDVAFTFERAKASPGTHDLTMMDTAHALDATTVQITLSRPWITFVETFYSLGIVPAANYGPDYGRNPLGSGPFRLVSWSEGEQLIVEKNPRYYGDAGAFERITFLFTGSDVRLLAAQAGIVDMVAVPAQAADAVPEGFYARAVQSVDNRGLSLPFPPPREVDGRIIGNAVTSDPAIRRAINLWLDRDLIAEVALNGHGTPAFSPADGLPWAGATDTIVHDPKAAEALLDQAGWIKGPDGTRQKDGVRAAFPINYPSSDPTRQALAEIVAELLRPLGIEATATGGSWDSINHVMHSEPVLFGFGSHSPFEVYSLHAAEVGGVGYMNPLYYENQQVEALFTQAQSAPSLEASFPFWAEAAQTYGGQGDNAWAWLVNLDHVYFVDTCLDLGTTQIEPHGHGWPITATLTDWRWTCD